MELEYHFFDSGLGERRDAVTIAQSRDGRRLAGR